MRPTAWAATTDANPYANEVSYAKRVAILGRACCTLNFAPIGAPTSFRHTIPVGVAHKYQTNAQVGARGAQG